MAGLGAPMSFSVGSRKHAVNLIDLLHSSDPWRCPFQGRTWVSGQNGQGQSRCPYILPCVARATMCFQHTLERTPLFLADSHVRPESVEPSPPGVVAMARCL